MVWRYLAALLIFSGVVTTAAHAAAPLHDVVAAVGAPGQLTLRDAGAVVLAGVVVMDAQGWSAALREGDAVRLQPKGTDRYGVVQAILFIGSEKLALQEKLLSRGYAVLYDRAASPARWRKAEAAARAASNGIWGRREDWRSPESLADAVGQFVLMQGRVTRDYKGRAMWYLNFGADWKRDASLRIPRRAWRSMGKGFAVQQGACITARGVVFLDNGPMIEITRPEQIEVADANTCGR